ncbi:MAG: type II toxin-antitoxin system PemK/MazF family toxin [Candidatus Bathyarchaeota archaeon]|uniref:type II toxin-antitoxin system PemK/MazF family toxin n=1 Tax=Candidatus Bathycorpusculum sp. TaxID=2994959 RepID=UPI00281A4167|nr:type II toxin-antitoxin system PemK/MazF family toxin [Candidatus Termiticorpusculum sp.]MCL2257701.1 type II toxin-antitoxin system PemK/MazF family toxin [Candidatus Termiticorpusculum sp.]MCL2292174.1 type II toxin-antitoxin system PemK/MazF family toxin [Candidatus Termiticorpusculum sp.]
MPKPGDVILATVQFTDTNEVKIRPALVLFEELGNIIVAGITSNLKMKGILLNKSEGAIKDSVIKLNYLFTISSEMTAKVLFHLSTEKKQIVYSELTKRLNNLKTN